MMELNCVSCKGQWYIEETDGMEVRYCPYCADKIWEQDKAGSFDKALLKIVRMSGYGILNWRRTTGMKYAFFQNPAVIH